MDIIAKRLIWWVLSCPCEKLISAALELKLDRYFGLPAKCTEKWRACYSTAVECGLHSLIKQQATVTTRCGDGGWAKVFKKDVVWNVSRETCLYAEWLYWLSERSDNFGFCVTCICSLLLSVSTFGQTDRKRQFFAYQIAYGINPQLMRFQCSPCFRFSRD